jgi:type I restriction enzyme S subunit
MAGEWRTFRLGDVCSKIGSGATPRGGNSVYLEHGEIALIRSQNIYNDGFHRNGLVYLTEEHAAELNNVQVAENDVLLNITGDSVARSCQVATDVLPARVNQHVAIVRPDPTQLWPRFLRYYLISPSMQAEMLSLAAVGATRNALTKGMIESFEVLAPADVEEQRAIAHVLGSLDDKIEVNRRMNETLEGIARAIFKSWFVDFDPVRAKAGGEPPESTCRRLGLTPDLLALFPSRFQDSELGEIPEEWEISTIRELASNIQYGLSRSASKVRVGPHFLRITDIQGGRVDWKAVPYCRVSQEEYQRHRLIPGDVLVARTGASTGENIYLSIVPESVFASYLVRFQFAERAIARLVGAFMRTSAYFDFVASSIGGSAQPNASAQVLAQARLVVPPPEIARSFLRTVSPFDMRVGGNNAESNTLGIMRDSLLPKLLSGELRVPVEGEA